jgi:hypothetical protein
MADLTGKIAEGGSKRINNLVLDTVDLFYINTLSGSININLRPNSGFVGVVSLYRKEKGDSDETWSLVRTFTQSDLSETEAYFDAVTGVTDFAIGLSSLTTADVVCDLYAARYN